MHMFHVFLVEGNCRGGSGSATSKSRFNVACLKFSGVRLDIEGYSRYGGEQRGMG